MKTILKDGQECDIVNISDLALHVRGYVYDDNDRVFYDGSEIL